MSCPSDLDAHQQLPFDESWDTVVERTDDALGRFSLIDDMIIERGTKADWDLLHDLHYKAENLPLGPKFYRLSLYGETVGVLVTSTPKGLLRERHIAFPSIKPTGDDTRLTNTQRYNFINRNFRVISRFVIDTMYRGIGAGYMMMNLVSRMEGIKIMEIQSSMSKFNHFGQKAGFKFVQPMNANKYEQGLKFFRSRFDANPQDFESIVNEINAMEPSLRERTLAECREFYLRNSATEKTGAAREGADARVAAMSEREIIKAIQQMTLTSPMYGVFFNPDFGTKVPERMSLSQFHKQQPNKPLVLT